MPSRARGVPVGLEGAEPAWTDPAWLDFLLGTEARARRFVALCGEHGRAVPGTGPGPADLVFATLGALRLAEALVALVPRADSPREAGASVPPEEMLR